MALKLLVQYEQLVELIEQLSDEQHADLMSRLSARATAHRALTVEEKIQHLDLAKLDVAIDNEPSIRRSDWYGDDER